MPRRCSIYSVGAVGTEVGALSLEQSALESKWAPDPMLVQQEHSKQECPLREPTAGGRNARPSSVCQAHNSRQRRQRLKRNTREIEGSGALKRNAESLPKPAGHPIVRTLRRNPRYLASNHRPFPAKCRRAKGSNRRRRSTEFMRRPISSADNCAMEEKCMLLCRYHVIRESLRSHLEEHR